MTQLSKRIINAIAVEEKFGGWPQFHDFEVVKIVLDRSRTFVEMQVYGFQALPETDEKGVYKLKNRCIITLHFNDCSEVTQGFNRQNVLSCVIFEDVDDSIRTTLGPCYGVSGFVVSKTVEIASIVDIVQ